jgi:hypothetical protein
VSSRTSTPHVGTAKVVAMAAASEAVVAEAKAAAMVVTMAAAMSAGLREATVVAVQTVVAKGGGKGGG